MAMLQTCARLVFSNNTIFQYFIPLHKDDEIFNVTGMQLQYCPPLSIFEFKESDFSELKALDLSSSELNRDDLETLTLTFDKKTMESLIKLDPNTGKTIPVDSSEINEQDIKQIVLVPKGFSVLPEMFRKNNIDV